MRCLEGRVAPDGFPECPFNCSKQLISVRADRISTVKYAAYARYLSSLSGDVASEEGRQAIISTHATWQRVSGEHDDVVARIDLAQCGLSSNS